MPMPALKDAIERKQAIDESMDRVFKAATNPQGELDLKLVPSTEMPSGLKSSHDLAGWIRDENEKSTNLSKEIENLKAVDAAATARRYGRQHVAGMGHEDGDADSQKGGRSGGWGGDGAEVSVGELFVKSRAYKDLNGRQIGELSTLDIGLKTLMTTAAGWAPEVTRTGRVVDFATRPIQVAQLIPQTTTAQSAVRYMEETTFTNNAAEIAEGGTYPESVFALTEQSVLVRKISVFLPVTDEQLEDETQVMGYLNNRLAFQVRQRLDSQLLVGNGTAPNLRGLLNVVGIQTQARATDPGPDAIYKAMTKIRTTGQAEPNLVVMNPTDWMNIRLLRTADGIYIWGNPSDSGPERVWGLQVSQAQAETLATAIVADTQFLELANRSGLDVQVSNSHSTFFAEGKQAIRADIRVAFVVYRPAAVCTVTGL
jgi:HK97 family phage major capsid protein